MAVRSVAVFCGSKNGKDPIYAQHTAELGKLLAANNIRAVYGGGNVGIMGLIADSVMQAGGAVSGVIPQVLVEWERQHTGITELFVVNNMHERKKMMYDLSDAAIILPGGFGTLDELFEMITWNQLSIHDKHIFILNSNGFYDHLIAHISRMQEEGFLYEAATQRLRYASDPETIISMITAD
ncbi:MAG: TIGR00730 family Rossman fold protein [Chitinophagaceae bacterium]|nr:MAG: TIGR00730 family Rossman fold protein [Chitinophagaceae bacterium]